MENLIHEHGYWLVGKDSGEHACDKETATAIAEYLKQQNCKNVVDIGCGEGGYVKHFIESGLDAVGFDGNPNTPELTNNLCNVMDFSQDCNIGEFDWVVSLEVGEHMPEKYESTFINNLAKTAKTGIILSWATVGQAGFGHFNCKNNDYIKSMFYNRGFVSDVYGEQTIRMKASPTFWWFKNTIMVFKRK